MGLFYKIWYGPDRAVKKDVSGEDVTHKVKQRRKRRKRSKTAKKSRSANR